MLEVREEDIDRITELFYRMLNGEVPGPLVLPEDGPDNEVRQVAEYASRFAAEYRELANAIGPGLAASCFGAGATCGK